MQNPLLALYSPLLLLPYAPLLIAVIFSWKRRDFATGACFILALCLAIYSQIL